MTDAPGNIDDTVYVGHRTCNGKRYTNTWISHADLTAGGMLDATLADQPAQRTVADVELLYSASQGHP